MLLYEDPVINSDSNVENQGFLNDWLQNRDPSTTLDFWLRWLFSQWGGHIGVLCCFFSCFFSLTYGSWGQAWGINRRSHLEAPCYFCQNAFTLRQRVWWWPDGWAIHYRFGIGGRRGQSVCWKRCLLHNVCRLSISLYRVEEVWHLWTGCSWDETNSDALLTLGSGCLSGLYLTLCFSWTVALCHVTVTFARGIFPFLHLQTCIKSKYWLLLLANSSLQLLSNSYRPM